MPPTYRPTRTCTSGKTLASDSCCRCWRSFKLAPAAEDLAYPADCWPAAVEALRLPQSPFDANNERPSRQRRPPDQTFDDWPLQGGVPYCVRPLRSRPAGGGPGDGLVPNGCSWIAGPQDIGDAGQTAEFGGLAGESLNSRANLRVPGALGRRGLLYSDRMPRQRHAGIGKPDQAAVGDYI